MTDKKLQLSDKEYSKGAYQIIDNPVYRDAINELIKPFRAEYLQYKLSKTQLRDLLATVMMIMEMKHESENTQAGGPADAGLRPAGENPPDEGGDDGAAHSTGGSDNGNSEDQ